MIVIGSMTVTRDHHKNIAGRGADLFAFLIVAQYIGVRE